MRSSGRLASTAEKGQAAGGHSHARTASFRGQRDARGPRPHLRPSTQSAPTTTHADLLATREGSRVTQAPPSAASPQPPSPRRGTGCAGTSASPRRAAVDRFLPTDCPPWRWGRQEAFLPVAPPAGWGRSSAIGRWMGQLSTAANKLPPNLAAKKTTFCYPTEIWAHLGAAVPCGPRDYS